MRCACRDLGQTAEVILERGDIQFCLQPAVQPAEAMTVELRVASLFAILSPEGGALHRRLRVGKKRMPQTPRERFWARIERVGSLQHAFGNKLEPETYTTKTRGERYQPAARPVALGTYAFVQHGDHVHFDYDVEPGFELDVEDAPTVDSASHIVLFKAPGEARAIWTHRGAITQLDDEGAELVLVGSCQATDAASASSS
jgi:hypothetical protein